MLLFLWIILIISTFTANSANTCLNTTSLCNTTCQKDYTASKCTISNTKILSFPIDISNSFYEVNTQTEIKLTAFEIYLKATHEVAWDIRVELYHSNISIVLLESPNGATTSVIDVILSDNSSNSYNYTLEHINCGCKTKAKTSLVDTFKNGIFLDFPFVLKISDFVPDENGQFGKWCISKLCYTQTPTDYPTQNDKLTESPTLDPTVNSTDYPTQNEKYTEFPTKNPTVNPNEMPTKNETFGYFPTKFPTKDPTNKDFNYNNTSFGKKALIFFVFIPLLFCIILLFVAIIFFYLHLKKKKEDEAPSEIAYIQENDTNKEPPPQKITEGEIIYKENKLDLNNVLNIHTAGESIENNVESRNNSLSLMYESDFEGKDKNKQTTNTLKMETNQTNETQFL